jgi:serine/threonine protein kinase
MSPSKVSPADFQVLKVVGQGAFGKVRAQRHSRLRLTHTCEQGLPMRSSQWRPSLIRGTKGLNCGIVLWLQVFQVRKRDTGRIYAMKVMRKVGRVFKQALSMLKCVQPPCHYRCCAPQWLGDAQCLCVRHAHMLSPSSPVKAPAHMVCSQQGCQHVWNAMF